jgi:FkbM family methyltransferase
LIHLFIPKMPDTITFVSPNQKEVEFLNCSDKKDEYMEHLVKCNLSKTSIVVDVGANVGAFSCAISKYLGAEAHVVAIEPFMQTFGCLSKNTAGLPVKCRKFAIGTTEGELVGSFLPEYTLLSGFHVGEEDKKELEALAGRSLDKEFTVVKEKVKCLRLDNFLEQEGLNSKVDVLKIDVEKSELDVLLSLGDRLKDVGCVAAEVHEHNLKEFKEILEGRYGVGNCWVSVKDLPKFALAETPNDWNSSLNTYIVFAK